MRENYVVGGAKIHIKENYSFRKTDKFGLGKSLPIESSPCSDFEKSKRLLAKAMKVQESSCSLAILFFKPLILEFCYTVPTYTCIHMYIYICKKRLISGW